MQHHIIVNHNSSVPNNNLFQFQFILQSLSPAFKIVFIFQRNKSNLYLPSLSFPHTYLALHPFIFLFKFNWSFPWLKVAGIYHGGWSNRYCRCLWPGLPLPLPSQPLPPWFFCSCRWFQPLVNHTVHLFFIGEISSKIPFFLLLFSSATLSKGISNNVVLVLFSFFYIVSCTIY